MNNIDWDDLDSEASRRLAGVPWTSNSQREFLWELVGEVEKLRAHTETAEAEIRNLRSEARKQEEYRLNAETALRSRAAAAEMRVAVLDGSACAEGRKAGRGGCGMCAWCCREARDRAEAAETFAFAANSSYEVLRERVEAAEKDRDHLLDDEKGLGEENRALHDLVDRLEAALRELRCNCACEDQAPSIDYANCDRIDAALAGEGEP